MTLEGRMTDVCEVWTRTAESDTWTCTQRDLPARISLLQPGGQRREFMAGGASEATHTARMQYAHSVWVKAGRRLRVQSSPTITAGTEYAIEVVRARPEPRPGFLTVLLVEEKATLP